MDFQAFCQWTIVAVASPGETNPSDQKEAPSQMRAAIDRTAKFPPSASAATLLTSTLKAFEAGDTTTVSDFLKHNCGVGS